MATEISIHPKYRKAVLAQLSNLRHEGVLFTEVPQSFSTTLLGVTFSVSTDSQGTILDAKHFGAKGAVRGILEGLCTLAVGRPIREISEHGLIYLEHEMRDPGVVHEIKGLLTPENADPSFQLPLKMVRTIFKSYEATVVTAPTKNFWIPNPDENWTSLSESEQRHKIETTISEVTKGTPLGQCKIEIVEIRHVTRVVISVSGYQDTVLLGSALMQLERFLKTRLEPQIELTLESIEDRNKRIGRTEISRSVGIST